MKVTAVDSAKDLYLLEDIFPTELFDIHLENLPWQDVPDYPRQMIETIEVDQSHVFTKCDSTYNHKKSIGVNILELILLYKNQGYGLTNLTFIWKGGT